MPRDRLEPFLRLSGLTPSAITEWTTASSPHIPSHDAVEDDHQVVQVDSATSRRVSLRDEVAGSLNAIRHRGDIAAVAACRIPLDIELTIHDVVKLSLGPLEDLAPAEVELIKSTALETQDRGVWELDASRFSCPSMGMVEYACKDAARELGVGVPMQANLLKLLLFDKTPKKMVPRESVLVCYTCFSRLTAM